jgi:hypothetical protein
MLVKLSLLIVAVGIAALVLFLLLDIAYLAWGALGALAVVAGVLLLYAWIHDRRAVQQYEDE